VIITDQETIQTAAFYNCSNINTVVLNSSLKTILKYAFYNCTNLSIYCEENVDTSSWGTGWYNSNIPIIRI
jgi:hypothetical protein